MRLASTRQLMQVALGQLPPRQALDGIWKVQALFSENRLTFCNRRSQTTVGLQDFCGLERPPRLLTPG
jgi:hypothetical protein